jgi:hypothetical protein
VEDVAVRVLEPGGLELSGDMDIAFSDEPRQIVVLEGDPLGLEGLDDSVQIVTDTQVTAFAWLVPAYCDL